MQQNISHIKYADETVLLAENSNGFECLPEDAKERHKQDYRKLTVEH